MLRNQSIRRFCLSCGLLFLFLTIINVEAESDIANNQIIFSNLGEGQDSLSYVEADLKDGWYAKNIKYRKDLIKLFDRYKQKKGMIIPVFPTVYSPGVNFEEDRVYYDYILKESGITRGKKILVIGSGSGADAWAAWIKAGTQIYTIDINILAVANTKATARLAGFTVEAVQGDIRTMRFPTNFDHFDYVLWNMPFMMPGDYAEDNFHDYDNGDILDRFLKLLPRLLKKGGQAILFNREQAASRIHFTHQKIIKDKLNCLFIITND